MHDPDADVRPRELDVEVADLHARAGRLVLRDDGERDGHGVELRRLLEEVVVVFGDPADRVGQLVERALLGNGVADLAAVVLVDGGDARRVHPHFHDEGPAVQADDWRQEAERCDVWSHWRCVAAGVCED